FWVAARPNPVKATFAASRYLTDLKNRFHGDWYLAWAGYNAGEGKVDRAIRRESTRDFWRMMSKGRTLRAETKHYVPKLIAAALIAKHPERFGFKVDYADPWDVDEVFIPNATDLHVIAKTAGLTIDQVRDLNPELRRFCTPPGGWNIRLPKGTRDAFLAEFQKLGAGERRSAPDVRGEGGRYVVDDRQQVLDHGGAPQAPEPPDRPARERAAGRAAPRCEGHGELSRGLRLTARGGRMRRHEDIPRGLRPGAAAGLRRIHSLADGFPGCPR